MSDELDIISPPSEDVKLADGESITITPVRMGKLREFAGSAAPIASDLMVMADGGDVDLAALLLGDELLKLVAIGTCQTTERLEQLGVDEFLALAFAVVRVNADFFARRLLPQVLKEVAAMQGMVAAVKVAAGQQSSKP